MLLLAGAVTVSEADAAPAGVSSALWEAHLVVSDATTRQRLSVGMRHGATAGYDIAWDVPMLLGDGIQTFFDRPTWPRGDRYMRDIRAPQYPASFDFVVNPVLHGEVVMTLDLRFVPYGCERVDFRLHDLQTGEDVDMRQADGFRVELPAGQVRRFSLEASRVQNAVPAPPTHLSVSRLNDDGRYLLRWSPAAGGAVAGYRVYRSVAGGAWERTGENPVYETQWLDWVAPAAREIRYAVHSLSYDLCESRDAAVAAPPAPSGWARWLSLISRHDLPAVSQWLRSR